LCGHTKRMQRSFESLVACFSCEIRADILHVLVERGPMTMGALAAEFAIAASTASAHVAVLRDVGVVDSWRSGREIHVEAIVAGVEFVIIPLQHDGAESESDPV
jgi:predicted transcriptional regulator